MKANAFMYISIAIADKSNFLKKIYLYFHICMCDNQAQTIAICEK